MIRLTYASIAIGGAMLLCAALPAQAASLTSVQTSAIISLLQSFGADSGTIASVNVALGGSGTVSTSVSNSTSSSNPSSCLSLYSNLGIGSQDVWHGSGGTDVADLQRFLGISPATGYFGAKTQAAVEQWQASHGIQASGYVGSQTRAAMECGSNSVSVQPNMTITQSSNTTVTEQGTGPYTITTTSGTPTISGTATGLSTVYVYVAPIRITTSTVPLTSLTTSVPVLNGNWSLAINSSTFPSSWFSNGALPSGAYQYAIQVSATSAMRATDPQIYATLTVNASN